MSNAWRPSARLGAAVGLSCTLALSTLAVDLRAEGPYEPTRESLDTHPLPQWWRDAKFGIFIHWGVYAVPAYALPGLPVLGYAEWYWAMQQIPGTPTWLHHRSRTEPMSSMTISFRASAPSVGTLASGSGSSRTRERATSCSRPSITTASCSGRARRPDGTPAISVRNAT